MGEGYLLDIKLMTKRMNNFPENKSSPTCSSLKLLERSINRQVPWGHFLVTGEVKGQVTLVAQSLKDPGLVSFPRNLPLSSAHELGQLAHRCGPSGQSNNYLQNLQAHNVEKKLSQSSPLTYTTREQAKLCQILNHSAACLLKA